MESLSQKTLVAQFWGIVAKASKKTAVIDSQNRVSFEKLALRVSAITKVLEARGVHKGDLVGVLLDRNTILPAVLLSILGCRAAYLPLDKGDPTDKQLRSLLLCPCSHLFGNREDIDRLSNALVVHDLSNSPELIAFEELDFDSQDYKPPISFPTPNDLAYVLMTSGSTGEPKAVNVSHQNVSSLLQSAISLLDFSDSDRYLATSPLTFDASVPELFLPLVTGATIVLQDRDLVLEPNKLGAVIDRTGSTVVQTTPSTWATVFSNVETFPKPRVLITHGEAVSLSFARELATRAELVLNLYGPTETTVWATGHRLTTSMPDGATTSSAPIGKPLQHIETTILSAAGKQVAIGTPGELCLGGPSVSSGYRNDPDRTGESFYQYGGTSFYRTGDLVQTDADGVIHYLGRIDDQMSIHGFRIEPGEIEDALLGHIGVSEAAVTWFKTGEESRGIVAAVVPNPETAPTPKELRSFLATRLNRTQLPSRFVFFDALPLLSSGKLDRNKIRQAAVLEADISGEPSTSPKEISETEKLVASVWKDVLEIDAIEQNDEFFLLGGDSLSAVDVCGRLEKALGSDIPVFELFEHPRLSDFAAKLAGKTSEDQTNAQPSTPTMLIRRDGDDGLPLFFALADYTYANSAGQLLTCPLYNLTIWNQDEGLLKLNSIEELASRYFDSIKKEQPEGPYRLAGYSVGGILAFELARQLVDANDEVSCLFLLDPTTPTRLVGIRRRKPQETQPSPEGEASDGRVRTVLPGVETSETPEWQRRLLRAPTDLRNLTFWPAYKRVTAKLKSAGRGSAFPDIDQKTRYAAMRYSLGRMAARYTARKLNINATLAATDFATVDVWSELLGSQTSIHQIDSDHRGLFKAPHDRVWTELLLDALNSRAQKAVQISKMSAQ